MTKLIRNIILIGTTGPIGIGYAIYDNIKSKKEEKEKKEAQAKMMKRLAASDEAMKKELEIYNKITDQAKEIEEQIDNELASQMEEIMNMDLEIN